MQGTQRNDQKIIDAVAAQNRGDHKRAENLFRDAGNQIRNPAEKQMLWDAAKRSNQIYNSD